MRYFFGFLAAVAVLVLLFVLILRGFGGHKPAVQSQLTDYAPTQTVMRMVVEGPVNADADHRVAQVTVGRDSTNITLFQGYQHTVLQSKSYDSNQAAYTTFLRALQLQGYIKGNPNPKLEDSRGVCPLGRVYTFEVITGSSTVQQFWTTSCGGGTFRGNTATIRQLFRLQVPNPDYSRIISGTGLL